MKKRKLCYSKNSTNPNPTEKSTEKIHRKKSEKKRKRIYKSVKKETLKNPFTFYK